MNILKKKTEQIKKKYQFHLIDENIGGFFCPLDIFADENRLFVVDDRKKSSDLVIIDLKTKKEISRIFFDKNIRYINYCKTNNSIYYGHNFGKDVYIYNLTEKKTVKMNLEQNNFKFIYSIKIVEDLLYILDILGNSLSIYNLQGKLEKIISLENKFESPLQFCKIPNSDKILFSRNNCTNTGYYDPNSSGFNPKFNLAYYDLSKDKIEYLPIMDLSLSAQIIYQIISDNKGYVYINSFDMFVKLDYNFNVIFKTEINKKIKFNKKNLPSHFYSTAIMDNSLFISERHYLNRVLQFAI